MNRPNVFILGVQKCGTSTLAEVMAAHPEVFVPSVKETYFFCDEQRYAQGADWYVDEFYSAHKAKRAALRADATPFYLASIEALQRIAAFADPAARFIVILRDPAKRAYSAFWHQKRLGNEPLPFGEALDAEAGRIAAARAAGERWWRHAYMEVGRYATHLRRAFDLLGRERVLVLTERALVDTDRCAARISEHVGLPAPLSWMQRHANPASMPRFKWLQRTVTRDNWIKQSLQRIVPREARSALGSRVMRANVQRIAYPPMPSEDRSRLQAFFAPEIEQLRAIDALEPWCRTDLARWASTQTAESVAP